MFPSEHDERHGATWRTIPVTKMLPLGVLIPTRNAIALLPAHLETMRPWLDLAEEIVVVDSDSQDGTVPFLREKLSGRNVRFFNREPGIYDCWNFGLQQIKARYTYISTVGDGITRDGLLHLVEVAERFMADAVVSPPDLVDAAGKCKGRGSWPVHRLIERLGIRQPTLFDGLLPFVLAMAYCPFTILGSAASNLYRTAVLQQKPFPSDFGWIGDAAWGVTQGLNLRLVLSPQRFSFYRHHRRNYPSEVYDSPDAEGRLCERALAMFEQACQNTPTLRAEVERLELDPFLRQVVEVHSLRSELLRLRKRWWWLWICFPRAWSIRHQRNLGRRECERRLVEVVAKWQRAK